MKKYKNMPNVLFEYSGVINKPFKLVKDNTFTLSNGETIYIPKGYLTDFASVPKILRLFTDNIGRDHVAFIIHDYLYNFAGYYQSKQDYDKDINFKWVNRKFADKEMRYAQKNRGASQLRLFVYYWGVRVGGLTRFNKI